MMPGRLSPTTGRKIAATAIVVFFALAALLWLPRLSRQPAVAQNLLSQPGPTFRVPADEIQPHWTVIAYGDTRFTDPADTSHTNPAVRRWLVEAIAQQHPDALLISGDLPYNGSNSDDYAIFRHETAAWRSANLRVYPALGNHELKGEESRALANWWDTFPQLNGRRWYSVEFADAYFITLDSDLPLLQGSQQGQWLAGQLAHLPATARFVFFSLHHPPLADPGGHDLRANETALSQFLESAAKNSATRFIVIAGHVHNYERFERQGVTYLVAGGGGAKPHLVQRSPDDLYKHAAQINYHYLRFTFDGERLNAVMIRVADPQGSTPSWEVRDRFTISAAKVARRKAA